jgi:uncharacterized protein YprB with RNaseH-like and TPR domain
MIEFDFYSYDEDKDRIKIYSEEVQNYFSSTYYIDIETVDFDENQNIVLYIEHSRNKINPSELEGTLLENFKHLNDVEVRNMKILLTFDSKEIEIC